MVVLSVSRLVGAWQDTAALLWDPAARQLTRFELLHHVPSSREKKKKIEKEKLKFQRSSADFYFCKQIKPQTHIYFKASCLLHSKVP